MSDVYNNLEADYFQLRYEFRTEEERWRVQNDQLRVGGQQLQQQLSALAVSSRKDTEVCVASCVMNNVMWLVCDVFLLSCEYIFCLKCNFSVQSVKKHAEQETREYVQQYRSQVLDREENVCMYREQYAVAQKMYEARLRHLEEKHESLLQKYDCQYCYSVFHISEYACFRCWLTSRPRFLNRRQFYCKGSNCCFKISYLHLSFKLILYRYKTLDRRRRLEIEGFSSEIVLVRKSVKNLARNMQLVRLASRHSADQEKLATAPEFTALEVFLTYRQTLEYDVVSSNITVTFALAGSTESHRKTTASLERTSRIQWIVLTVHGTVTSC